MRKLGFLLVLATVSLLAACGGGSNNSIGTVTAVSVSCSPSTVASGQTSQCSATVTGTGNFSSAVNWSASAGSISSSGLLTAPTVTSSTTVTVTATSVQNSAISGTAAVTVNPQSAGANVAPIVVDAGPDPSTFISANVPFVTVTLCVPGTTTCQTIDHVTVDTGSSGFRVISSVLTIPLPAENLSSGNPLYECTVFADGFVWGSVATANITVAGESTSTAVPVQIMIPSTTSPAPPGSCSNQTTGPNEGGSVDAFGANAIIGVGLFQQDCGPACTTQNSSIPDIYYACPSSGCNPTYVTIAQQVPNPVTTFPIDNNGVLIQLPSVPDGGSLNVDGSLIFGIGTESNNGLGSAVVYQVPDTGNDAGNFITTYAGQAYPQSFVDSGSNGYFFLDPTITGIPACSGNLNMWYCPTTSPDNLTATNQGQNSSGTGVGSAVPVNFSIEDTTTLFNTSNTAFSTLGGPTAATCGTGSNPVCAFDWGLSFFYSRNVFTAIDTMTTPAGDGPYWAF
ncbi:MAG: DUF3443 family protein [Candidatus Korobacteraceae bacterium]